MHPDFCELLLTADTIHDRVIELGDDITTHYRQLHVDHVLIVGVMSGAVIFLADLVRRMPLPVRMALLTVTSYAGATTQTRGAKLTQQLNVNIRGEHVLIVDDILDTGGTLGLVQTLLRAQAPASLQTAVLLRKPGKAPTDVTAEYIGFDIPDRFVVGYGLDYNGAYRNVPDIGVLRPELYADQV